MGKLGRKPSIHFVNIFSSIHFHHIYVIQYTDLFTLTITKLYLVYLCSSEHWAKIVTPVSTAWKVPRSWNFIVENSRQFLFKTKDLLLQKVLINKFLEHDGMRVLFSALFSSCMIGYIPWWEPLLDRNFYYYTEASLLWGKIHLFYEQTEKTSDVPDFCVCDIKMCKLKIMCLQF